MLPTINSFFLLFCIDAWVSTQKRSAQLSLAHPIDGSPVESNPLGPVRVRPRAAREQSAVLGIHTKIAGPSPKCKAVSKNRAWVLSLPKLDAKNRQGKRGVSLFCYGWASLGRDFPLERAFQPFLLMCEGGSTIRAEIPMSPGIARVSQRNQLST